MATLSSSFLASSSLSLTTNNVSKTSSNVSSFTIVAQKKVKKIRKEFNLNGFLSLDYVKEDIEHVGKKGELKNVRAGYFRNYLLPLGKAQLITPAVIKEMKMEEERIEAEKIRVKEEALLLAQLFETCGSFKVKRKGGKSKQIFGTVTAQDFVDIVKAQLQREVDKRIVFMPEIREAGEYTVELKLHPEVSAQVRLSVFAK